MKSSLSIPAKMKLILTNPDKFFNAVKNENIKQSTPLGFGIAIALILSVSGFLFAYTYFTQFVPINEIERIIATEQLKITPDKFVNHVITEIAFKPVFYVGLLMIYSAVMYYIIRFVVGKKPPIQTLKIFVYGSTPFFLLSWGTVAELFKFFGFMGSIWSLYLYYKGLIILHDASPKQATFIILLFVLIISPLFYLFYIDSIAPLTYFRYRL